MFIEGGTLAILDDPISPANIASTTNSVIPRVEIVPGSDLILDTAVIPTANKEIRSASLTLSRIFYHLARNPGQRR